MTLASSARLVLKAHRHVYHSTLGWRVIKKRRRKKAHHLSELGEVQKHVVMPEVAAS